MSFTMNKATVLSLADEMIDQIRSGSADPMALISARDVATLAAMPGKMTYQQRIKTAMTHKRDDYWNYHGLKDQGRFIASNSIKEYLNATEGRARTVAQAEKRAAKATSMLDSLIGNGQEGWGHGQYFNHNGAMELRPGLAVIIATLGHLPVRDITLGAKSQGFAGGTRVTVWTYKTQSRRIEKHYVS